MIECIFTLDYEIYGNGDGSLDELVYHPAEKLKAIFKKWDSRLVVFVELAELEVIEAQRSDPALHLVKKQIQDFYREGFELGLHLHPQWYNAQYSSGKWKLDYREYNLCSLPHERIVQIVERSLTYLRDILGTNDFTPLSFRAGNWLFQPTRDAASVLADRGIKIDSSVFKGGLQHQYGLDYRRAMKNGYYWQFTDNVNVPAPQGILLEIPIYTQMVVPWKMMTSKRVGLQQKGGSSAYGIKSKVSRITDFLRLQHPLKLDFCRMTADEIIGMWNIIIKEDQRDPTTFKPIVTIGHTKDLIDYDTVESFLAYLKESKINVSTFEAVYKRLRN